MKHSRIPGLVLAIHPTSRGFGWVLFEGPLVPVDWGIASAKANRSAQCMGRFKQLLDQYQPSVLILEKYGEDDSQRSERIRSLAQTMRGFANNRDMDTPVYSREEVSAAVTNSKNSNRHTVALEVSEQLPELRHRLPNARKLWQSEDDRQCLFDAAALGITHYRLTRPSSRRT
jgi:Holliday junction resolvasome RuvABC endonuclease subunit